MCTARLTAESWASCAFLSSPPWRSSPPVPQAAGPLARPPASSECGCPCRRAPRPGSTLCWLAPIHTARLPLHHGTSAGRWPTTRVRDRPPCGGDPVPDHGARLPKALPPARTSGTRSALPLQPRGPPVSCSQRQLRAHDAEPCPALPREEAQTQGVGAGAACRVCPRRHLPVMVAFPGPQRISLRVRQAPGIARACRRLPRTWCAEAGHRGPVPQARSPEGAQPPCPPQSQAGQEAAAACPPRPAVPTPPLRTRSGRSPRRKSARPSKNIACSSLQACGSPGPEEPVTETQTPTHVLMGSERQPQKSSRRNSWVS